MFWSGRRRATISLVRNDPNLRDLNLDLKALAWCARLLSLRRAYRPRPPAFGTIEFLGPCLEETRLAEAFIICATDKDQTLAMLATVHSSAARSAALRIVTNHDKAEGAVNWVQRCALKIEDFDADGKFDLIMNELGVGQWQEAIEDAQNLSDDDFHDTPILFYAVAMTYLVQAVPEGTVT